MIGSERSSLGGGLEGSTWLFVQASQSFNAPEPDVNQVPTAKVRVIRFSSRHRAASGRTCDTSWSTNALDFINTAKCPPPSIGTNAFAGARMESTNERARLVGVVKSSAS
jgi:hypothetical protein